MGSKCDLQLDNASGIFQPGQIVTGSIQFKLEERALIKSFSYKFSGYAATRWEKPISAKKQKYLDQDANAMVQEEKPKQFYKNRDDYLAITYYMIGSESAMSNIVEAGSYSYNFSVRLPDHCPSSVESVCGHIRYEINVYIAYPDRSEIINTCTLTLIQPLDLRLNYQLLEPANIDCIEPIVRTKFWQRPMQLHVNIPQTGYIPGEKISVYVKILNGGLLVLQQLIYRLNMVGTYTGYNKRHKLKSKVERTNLISTFYALHSQKVNVLEHLQSLHLPATSPSLFETQCRCMQLSYEVEVMVQTSSGKREIHARVPLVVGTISLQDRQQPYLSVDNQKVPLDCEVLEASAPPPPDNSESEDAAAFSPLGASNLSVSMNSLSSTFKEADYMTSKNFNKEFKQTMAGEVVDFKPKYLYYNLDANIQEAEISSTN